MKNIILVFFFLLIGFKTIAQETIDVDDNKVHSFVQTKAEPKEGIVVFYNNFSEKFKTIIKPGSTKELTFYLEFVVEKDGSFSDVLINISGKIDEGTKETILKVLRVMPKWKPANHNGKVVRSSFTLPMKLQIDEKVYDELKNVLEVDNSFFEFKSECGLVKTETHETNIREEYIFICFEGYYHIIIKKINENLVESPKSDGIDEGAIIKNISFLGNKAIEKSFHSPHVGNGHIRMIELYKNEYFITIVASAKKPESADKLIEYLKRTFKLKL